MNILFIGDIFGSKGREAIKTELPGIKKKYKIDFTIANAENTTHGRSLSLAHYKDLNKYGIDFFTFGNHTWHLQEIKDVLKNKNVVRPANIPESSPESKNGVGTRLVSVGKKTIRITNLLGTSISMRYFQQTNPFVKLNEIIELEPSDLHIVDLHAETTSEKNAMLLAFSSKVSAIVGTHTHVQTNDYKIFNNTAYITDVGMTGASEGIIGAEPTSILDKFFERSEYFKLSPSTSKYQFNGIVISFNDKTNKPNSISPLFILQKK